MSKRSFAETCADAVDVLLSAADASSRSAEPLPPQASSSHRRTASRASAASSSGTSAAPSSMADSTEHFRLGRYGVLRDRLAVSGFLLLRGVVPRAAALAARTSMLDQLHLQGAIQADSDPARGAIADAPTSRRARKHSISQSRSVLQSVARAHIVPPVVLISADVTVVRICI